MSELRWSPITGEWIIFATERQSRPALPRDYCPFDPGSPEFPGEYEVQAIENRFPSLRRKPPEPSTRGDDFYRAEPARGVCEVVLYSHCHDAVIEDETEYKIRRVVDLWQNRFIELGGDPHVKYVFIFENRGEEIGVTIHHPHGQIYAYPFVPPFVERRLEWSRKHLEERGRCLYCEVVAREMAASPSRIVAENQDFLAFVPFWAKWSYEVNIYPKRHFSGLDEIGDEEKDSLARVLKTVLLKYDGLFEFRLPFIMAVFQRPTDGAEGYDHCHLSVEFYPPHRSRDKLKYLAGSETGAGAHINVTSPEPAAEELRRVRI